MEFLETSRSAKKFDPQRTARYRRADPRATNIVLGYESNNWETTNKNVQRQVSEGTNKLGTIITNNRNMTTARKRGMLSSSLTLGSERVDWTTESTNYVKHDLKTWGPRTALQRDSYSWTDKERRKLQDMRSSTNPISGKGWKLDPYIKLPPIVGSSINEEKIVAKNEANPSKPTANGIHHFNGRF